MTWQDLVLMLGGFGFSVALLPSVLRKTKMPWATPLITGGILTAYLAVYATLNLWLGFIAGVLTAGMWWYLLWVALKKRNMMDTGLKPTVETNFTISHPLPRK